MAAACSTRDDEPFEGHVRSLVTESSPPPNALQRDAGLPGNALQGALASEPATAPTLAQAGSTGDSQLPRSAELVFDYWFRAASDVAVVRPISGSAAKTPDPPFVSTTFVLEIERVAKGAPPTLVTLRGGHLPSENLEVFVADAVQLEVGVSYIAFFERSNVHDVRLAFAVPMLDRDRASLYVDQSPVSLDYYMTAHGASEAQ
jgi:hypothetical protein